MNIRFITDSASDMIYGANEDVTFLPLGVTFGQEFFHDGVDLSHQEFYEKLVQSKDFPTTSQISPAVFEETFEEVRKAGEVAIVITMSSKLSGTYQSACIAAEEFKNTVFVVDSENVTIGERCLVEYGLQLKAKGLGVQEILDELNREKKNIRLVALLDTLEYLKKGGRVSRTVAFAGGLLSIKPIVGVLDGEVQMLGKARGSKQGSAVLNQQLEKMGAVDFQRPYFLGYTGQSDELLQKYIQDSQELWGGHELDTGSVGSAIGAHAGPGAIAVAYFTKEN